MINVAETMLAHGYDSLPTSGGCETWMRDLGDHTMVWICTVDQGLHGDPDAQEWLLGRYGIDDSGFVCVDAKFTLAEALALSERIPSPLDRADDVTLTREQIEG